MGQSMPVVQHRLLANLKDQVPLARFIVAFRLLPGKGLLSLAGAVEPHQTVSPLERSIQAHWLSSP